MIGFLEVRHVKSEFAATVKSLPDVFKVKTPSLKQLEILNGAGYVILYLNSWIIDTVSFFNIGKVMKDLQVMETSLLIYQEYPFISIHEIYFVFNQAKKGMYGSLYDRLDGSIILTWFNLYWESRLNAAEFISVSQHTSTKERPGSSFSLSRAAQQHARELEAFTQKHKV